MGPKFVVDLIREKSGFAEHDPEGTGQIECSDLDDEKDFKSFGFVLTGDDGFASGTLNLEPSDYMDRLVVEEDVKDEKTGKATGQKVNKNYCWLHVMQIPPGATHGPKVVLGMPFIRKFTTVFDFEKKRLGFVDSALVKTGDEDSDESEEEGTEHAASVQLEGCRENCEDVLAGGRHSL